MREVARATKKGSVSIVSINRVNISGNLTRDPELTQTPGGTPVLRFGVAVNDRVQNKQTGEWQDRPNYVDCVMFNRRAESLSRILHKGMKVALEGRLRWSQWQDRETGKNRSKLEVVADEVDFMSQRQNYSQDQDASYDQDQGYTAAAPQSESFSASAPSAQTPPSADIYDDEIPF